MELLTFRVGRTKTAHTNLYCWPCRTVHELALTDVEKIVYALGASDADGGSPIEPSYPIPVPACLREVLRWADSPEAYLEHVEQGIECREKTPASEVTS